MRTVKYGVTPNHVALALSCSMRAAVGPGNVGHHSQTVTSNKPRNLKPHVALDSKIEEDIDKGMVASVAPTNRPVNVPYSKNTNFRSILGSLLRATKSSDLNRACKLIGNWMEHAPSELQTLTKSEFNNLKKVLSKCTYPPETAKLTLHSLQILAHVTAHSRNPMWSMIFLERLKARGCPPDGDTVAHLFTKKHIHHILNWVKQENAPINVPLAMKVLGADGSWSHALRLAREVETRLGVKNSEGYASGVLVPYLMSGGRWEEAFSIVGRDMMSGRLVDPQLVGEMVQRSLTRVNWEKAMELLAVMQRTSMDEAIESPSAFYELVDAAPSWQAAVAIHLSARNSCVVPDEHMTAAVLSQCETAGRWRTAARIFEIAVGDGAIQQLGPRSYESLIRTYQQSQQWSRALEAVQWMADAGHATNEVGFVSLVDICEQSGSWQPALRVGAMLMQTVKSDDVSLPTYNKMIRACALGGRWESALGLHQQLRQLPNYGVGGTLAVAAVMAACNTAKQWQMSLKFFDRLMGMQPRVVLAAPAYLNAVRSSVIGGQWGAALSILDQMHEAGISHDGGLRRYVLLDQSRQRNAAVISRNRKRQVGDEGRAEGYIKMNPIFSSKGPRPLRGIPAQPAAAKGPRGTPSNSK